MADEEYYEEEEGTSQTSKKGEGFLKAKKQKGELDEQLREYINEWRKQRGEEEERLRKEEAEKKAKEAEEKKKRLEEAEMKRQAMMQAQKEKQQAAGGKGGGAKMQGGANVQDARREMTKTKEQLEEEKKISLSIRINPLDVDAMDSDQLSGK